MAVRLSKGQKVDLTKSSPGLKKIIVGLGWDTSKYSGTYSFDLDASAFLLGGNGKVDNETNFVYYNNPRGGQGSVVHSGDSRRGEASGDDEQILIDLPVVPMNIQRVAITITINDAQIKNQNFGQVQNAYVRILNADTQELLIQYDLGQQFSVETAIVAAEIYRHGPEWKFSATGSGFQGGLAALCRNFGLEVEDETPAQPYQQPQNQFNQPIQQPQQPQYNTQFNQPAPQPQAPQHNPQFNQPAQPQQPAQYNPQYNQPAQPQYNPQPTPPVNQPYNPGMGQQPHNPGAAQQPYNPGVGQQPYNPAMPQQPYNPGLGQQPYSPSYQQGYQSTPAAPGQAPAYGPSYGNNSFYPPSTPSLGASSYPSHSYDSHGHSGMVCIRCGSNRITAGKKGFSVGKAALGAVLLGPIGLMGGFLGSNKLEFACLVCGARWKGNHSPHFSSFFENQARQAREIMHRYMGNDLTDALVAAAALVTAADGRIQPAERDRLINYFRTSDVMRGMDIGRVIQRFDYFIYKLQTDFMMGKAEALSAVGRLRDKPDAARLVVRLCVAIGFADGEFSSIEKNMVHEICREAYLNPAEFIS
ncbi:MAG: TerD family protein [Clostridia bacterium]|nr:TerD family protein [Clostridia bacterium]